MYQKLLLLLLSLGLPALDASAQKALADCPRLVVGIHIDQLQEDYLRWFMEGFSEGGFKELFKKGVVYRQVSSSVDDPDDANVTAALVCGCPPCDNGIAALQWLDRQEGQLTSCVLDRRYSGNYTQATCSPKNLRVSTLGDELKKASSGDAKVFSIGLDPESCILSGGHQPNGVFWLDDATGHWCTSTFYGYMPRWIENINDFGHMEETVDKAVWTPRYPLGKYIYMPHQKKSLIFHYTLSSLGADKGCRYKQTPMANTTVCRFASELIGVERMGQDDCPDLLNLHLSVGSALSGNDMEAALEMQDMYFRLDEDLAALFKDIDRKVGMEHTLVYVTSTGAPRQPAGGKDSPCFYPERCATLLNLYLGALYGNERWVLGCTDTQIYLDHKLINNKKADLVQMCRDAAVFLSEFEGVRQVCCGTDFLMGMRPADSRLADNFVKDRSGDLILRLETGRSLVWESRPSAGRQIQYAPEHQCLILYGAGTRPAEIWDEVQLTDVAPTLCRLLYIRPPTASRGKRLPLE